MKSKSEHGQPRDLYVFVLNAVERIVECGTRTITLGVVLVLLLFLLKDSRCLKIEYYLSLSKQRVDRVHDQLR